MLLYGNNKNQNVLQFGGLYTHAKFQVILLVNFKDMSNFNTCRNAVGLRGRHHYHTCVLVCVGGGGGGGGGGGDTAQERKSLSKIGSRHLSSFLTTFQIKQSSF